MSWINWEADIERFLNIYNYATCLFIVRLCGRSFVCSFVRTESGSMLEVCCMFTVCFFLYVRQMIKDVILNLVFFFKFCHLFRELVWSSLLRKRLKSCVECRSQFSVAIQKTKIFQRRVGILLGSVVTYKGLEKKRKEGRAWHHWQNSVNQTGTDSVIQSLSQLIIQSLNQTVSQVNSTYKGLASPAKLIQTVTQTLSQSIIQLINHSIRQ